MADKSVKLNPVTEKGIALMARGMNYANQIQRKEQPMRDLPFAVADTIAGTGALAVGGAADAARHGIKAGMRRAKGG